jgi:diadenosine tetraphosphatase ApaH/serine/threonine PP2A family protein phosphatase
MWAIVSDMHSNVEALEAVFEDISKADVSETLCLGDVVGYGPDPEETIDIVERNCRFTLSGNHDYAVVNRAERFNPLAEEAVEYTRRVLRPSLVSAGRKRARWKFLDGLPTRRLENGILYVHGSPRDERNEYILESDIVFGNFEKLREIFAMFPRLLFIGHTHVPGVISDDFRFWHPSDSGATYAFEPGRKYIVNVGSVGQPRDGDPRACYALAEPDRVIYRRVAYDLHRTMSRMDRIGPISREAAERLLYGR